MEGQRRQKGRGQGLIHMHAQRGGCGQPEQHPRDVAATIRTLQEDGRFRAVYEARTGCTVACHCGPNTIGVMFLNK